MNCATTKGGTLKIRVICVVHDSDKKENGRQVYETLYNSLSLVPVGRQVYRNVTHPEHKPQRGDGCPRCLRNPTNR